MAGSPGQAQPESALLVPVPEAEPLVGAWRLRHDPSAALGVAPHITLLYPFMPPGKLDSEVIERLRKCFSSIPPFNFALVGSARFPSVLYLAPEPAEPFVRLTTAIVEMYPEYPPYRGAYSNMTPHLTVAHTNDRTVLAQVEEVLAGMATPRGHRPRGVADASGRGWPLADPRAIRVPRMLTCLPRLEAAPLRVAGA